MILIFSKSDLEYSTECVIDWIISAGYSYIRVNGEDFYENMVYDLDRFQLNLIDEVDIDVCWFRRWYPSRFMIDKIESAGFQDSVLVNIHNQVANEYSELKNVFFNQFKDKEWLSSPAEVSISKLNVLGVAKALGFKVPETLVTSSKARLLNFLMKGPVICKPLTNVAYIYSDLDGISYKMLTKEIKKDFVEDHSNEVISTSQMFQRLIDKDIEIRAFYIDKRIYSMAIFSQDDETTSIDFRNYNNKYPNRNVPYKLPDDVHNMVVELFSKLRLSTGSVDLIKDTKGEYYFLEVNPVGQFLMVSDPCNYFLDKKIADYLISKI